MVAIRFGSVTLKRPEQALLKDVPDTVSLQIVDVRELHPPHGSNPCTGDC